MKYYTFRRESNNFSDILKDSNIKKHICVKILWLEHLFIGIDDSDERILSYLELKYGDYIKQKDYKDRTPIPHKELILFTDIRLSMLLNNQCR
jgi:hypothetical protein